MPHDVKGRKLKNEEITVEGVLFERSRTSAGTSADD